MRTLRPRLREYRGVRYLAHPKKALLKGWAQCGVCGRAWDDTASTDLTPSPAGRCPFEHWHYKGKKSSQDGILRIDRNYRRVPPLGEIRISLAVVQDDIPVRGNAMASDDAEADRQAEDEILERLDRGDEWAWACVTVSATLEVSGETFIGEATLGACSYKDEKDFRADGYFPDMVNDAIGHLYQTLLDAKARWQAASDVIEQFDRLEAAAKLKQFTPERS